MDVAITINDFCTTWGNANALSGQGEAVNFDDAKMQAFYKGTRANALWAMMRRGIADYVCHGGRDCVLPAAFECDLL